ncbi:hypothetical protein DPM19_15995 [Actinomadura craniellae]|uniref:Uncharacterized protein n=1 Tax=Actinomadura craniellae TaxID=2231787 RepID=A0A365H5T1_9ACTN|nr:hypothetical protein [Actinomadura craniellae]RAY14455.1 hypothetical protein DPM19_15995 [Actinomadura craniellae]
MLRIHDARTGQAEPVPSGPLRIRVHGPAPRTHVVGDLLRRVAGRTRREVRLYCAGSSAPERDLDELNVRPPDLGAGASAELHVAEHGGEPPPAGAFLGVRPATGPGTVPDGLDPLSVRLAMLRVPYRDPLDLGGTVLPDADAELRRLRGLVAGWARSPGRPMHRAYADEATAALFDDLDVRGALAVLDRLAADPEVPDGAKLETFIHLDLLLALDLVRDIGR